MWCASPAQTWRYAPSGRCACRPGRATSSPAPRSSPWISAQRATRRAPVRRGGGYLRAEHCVSAPPFRSELMPERRPVARGPVPSARRGDCGCDAGDQRDLPPEGPAVRPSAQGARSPSLIDWKLLCSLLWLPPGGHTQLLRPTETLRVPPAVVRSTTPLRGTALRISSAGWPRPRRPSPARTQARREACLPRKTHVARVCPHARASPHPVRSILCMPSPQRLCRSSRAAPGTTPSRSRRWRRWACCSSAARRG